MNIPAKDTERAVDERGLRVDVAAWGLVLHAGCRAIAIFLEAQSMAAAVGQAVLVEWGASRLGVTWSDPATPTTTARIARRVAIGAAIGVGLAALVFAILLATRGVSVERVTRIEASVLAIGFATAGVQAWRDELLQHGIILRALRDSSISSVGRVLACGVTSAGAALGHSDATARSVFVALLSGVVFGALWLRDRGAWQPWAAHASSRWTIGTLLSGGVVHSRLADDAWGGGSAGLLGGTAAVVALAPVGVLALGWAARRISPRSARVG
jgi:hypothetical protein